MASHALVVLLNQPQGMEAKMDNAFRRTVAEARRHGDLYFAGLLPEDRIIRAFGRARSLWQGWIYTPAVTIWVFLIWVAVALLWYAFYGYKHSHLGRHEHVGLIHDEETPT